mgnify:CR=1 FL=1
MEYIVSARKYRPLTFDSVVGQESLTATLRNSVQSNKLAHAYLFCGPRGVGKTTCARIFAKVINCENLTASGDACGECESCKAFAEQRSFNIFELDAASNNGVEHIKTLMDQTRIPPQVGKYKVFIIDEVHMLTTAAFNAFLKTLEEPPSYVVFILATTEKHKLLPTIISRCQIYDFERMTVPNIVNHLKKIADKEGITYEEEALNIIAEKADGGMRDALSVFDQVASYCQGNITREKVIADLNVLDSENYFKIIDLSLANNVTDIMLILDENISKGFDGGQMVNGLASHLRNIMMAKDPRTVNMIQVSQRQKEQFIAQAQKCSTAFIFKALKILNNCDVNYRQSSNKRLLVELTLIEVAQITQPEEPGSGRRPTALKTLFNKIKKAAAQRQATSAPTTPSISNPSNNVTQPAAKSPADNKQVSATATATASETKQESKKALNIPNFSKTGSGFSLKSLSEKTNIQTKVEEDDVVVTTVNRFTEEHLLNEWLSMCNRMALLPKHAALSARLRNLTPTITEHPQIELVFSNSLLMEEVNDIRRKIENTMRERLKNKDITFTLRLAKPEEIKKILSPRERYEDIIAKNSTIKKLFEDWRMTIV